MPREFKPGFRTQILAFLLLAVAATSTFYIYRLGLPGDFIFDDYPNLQTLAAHGGVKDWRTLQLYLDDAFAGPTGRPLSMLSFLIDVRNWPADPGVIKLKNILLHILNGLALAWVLTLALRQSNVIRNPNHILWITALTSAWWLLHPLHVSTVLYAIQRMAELSTLFVLLGIGGYLYGRKRLDKSRNFSYAVMAFSLLVGTALATFSKENGAILPLLVLVLEYTLLSRSPSQRPNNYFLAIFLWIPSLVLIGYIASFAFTTASSAWEMRGFTPIERVLTETRILFQYLGEILVPRPETGGVYRDTITVSRSLISPVSTLFSLLGVAGLISVALAVRRRLPLLSAAILFFFAGHLIESTTISLELFFEHRNYLPSMLLFLPLAQLVVLLSSQKRASGWIIAIAVTGVLLTTLSMRTSLWSDRTSLYLHWAERSPHSVRAQLSASNVLQLNGQREAAVDRLKEAIKENPDSLALRVHLARFEAQSETVTPIEIDGIVNAAEKDQYSNEAVAALTTMVDDIVTHKAKGITARMALRILRATYQNPRFSYDPIRARLNHDQGRLYAYLGEGDKAEEKFMETLKATKSVETAMMQAAILATNEQYCAALRQLDQGSRLLPLDASISARREFYNQELPRLRQLIEQDASAAGTQCKSRREPAD